VGLSEGCWFAFGVCVIMVVVPSGLGGGVAVVGVPFKTTRSA